MATPRDLTSSERERLKQQGALTLQAQKDTSLDLDKTISTVLDFYTKQGATAERRSATAMKEVSDLEQLRAKLNADAYTKALGSVGSLVQQAMRGAITPRDQQDLIIKLKELQLASTRALTQVDNAALQRYTTLAQAVAGPQADSATLTAEVYKQAVRDLKANGQYNPSLTGTVKAIEAMGPVPAELASDWSQIKSMSDDRTDLINDINLFASQVPDNVGAMGPQAQAAEATKFIASMDPNAISAFAAKLGRLPNAGSLDQPIADKQAEATVAKDKVDEFLKMDPMAIITQLKGGAGEAKAKDDERLRILSSDKFQRWAASNGLRVGSVRPATEADKGLPGYIASKNVVYVAGAEDDRALGIATKQATMKPSQMLIPRRGLETRKYVEATVGGAPQPGLTNFTKVAFDDKAKKAVFIRADGSAVDEDGGSYDTELASKLTSQPLSPEQVQKVNEDMAGMLTTTGGGQRIRGVETALMWSDPPDAIMAVETPEGNRVIIRKQDEKNINVLSGGEERKQGVVRSLLAKARERIARPGEAELRAADEAAMAEVDKAREAELEKKRQAEQAAKPDRTQPAAAKAAVETAMAEEPIARPEAAKPKTPGYTAEDISADVGRAKQLVGLGEKPGASIELQKLARRARGAEAYMTSDPNQYRAVMLQLSKEASDFLSKRNQVLGPGKAMPAEDTSRERALYLASQPEVQVTPTSAAGKEVREVSPVNMTGANAPQTPGVATGTPATAPAVPQTANQRRVAALRDARFQRQQYEKEMSTLGGGSTR
jgi:hypothetical protein